jgi:hypothetical protein
LEERDTALRLFTDVLDFFRWSDPASPEIEDLAGGMTGSEPGRCEVEREDKLGWRRDLPSKRPRKLPIDGFFLTSCLDGGTESGMVFRVAVLANRPLKSARSSYSLVLKLGRDSSDSRAELGASEVDEETGTLGLKPIPSYAMVGGLPSFHP